MNCLVIDTLDRDTSLHVPSISSAPDAIHPIDEFIVINTDDSSAVTEIEISVDVIDPSDRPVEWILTRDQASGISSGELPATGVVRRFSPPAVSVATLPDGCHSLVLHVSHEFQPGFTEPQESGDIARAVWWYAKVSDSDPDIDPASCGQE